MCEKGRVVLQTPTETHRIAGIVGLQIDNTKIRRVRTDRKTDPVENAEQPRRVGGYGGALDNKANNAAKKNNHHKKRSDDRSQGAGHLAGFGLRHQHRRRGLPDMRTDRAADSLSGLTNLLAIDPENRVAVRAGQQH